MITVNTDHFPFLLVRVDSGEHREHEWQRMVAESARFSECALDRQSYHVSISVSANTMSVSERQFVARAVAKVPPKVQERNIGTFIILLNPLGRFAVTALGWIVPSLANITAVATADQAILSALPSLKARQVEPAKQKIDEARAWLHAQVRAFSHGTGALANSGAR